MRCFKNATILQGEELEATRGYLVVEKGAIAEIGSGRCPYKSALDVKRGIIAPSFTNAHVHLGDAVAQDFGACETLEKRVGRGGLKFEALKKHEKEVPRAIRAALKEMLLGGTTAFSDFREGGVKGIAQLKSALIPWQEEIVLGRPDGDSLEKVLKSCSGIGVSSVADYSTEELKKIADAVKKQKKLLAIHAGETSDDIAEALRYSPDFIVHATNASEASVQQISASKTPVVLCPRSNAVSGAGLPKIRELLEETLVALGTDNVMLNSPSMLREAEFAFKLMRGMSRDCKLDAREILKAATLNGRKILHLPSTAVEEKGRANFIIFKARKYLYDPVLAIIHRYEAQDIRGIVAGEQFIGRQSLV